MIDWPLQENYYPNISDNIPLPSFPQQIPPPTGESDEGDLINVAYAIIWQPVLLAAVDQLLLPSTWAGTHDEVIFALQRAQMLKDALTIPVEPATSDVETPYWDDASDVDDNATPDAQLWYGEVADATAPASELTFTENILVWTFAGLLAIAGSPAAAIAFTTVAPKFLIAQKAGDVGEVIRIVLDGHDVTTIDTTGHAGEIIQTPVIGDPTLSTHQLYLIKVS